MKRLILSLLAVLALTRSGAAAPEPLRVCADPNNLPFSNARGEGFENRLAELLARDLGTTVRYTWWAQRRGFVRNTLNARQCDVVMGMPTGLELVATTRPYYRSTYVFVTRRDEHRRIASFDDPALRRLRVGVQLVGDDGANTPPAHALARRGIVRNVTGYPVYGDYRLESPPSRIVAAVARGEIDVAAAWGPMAGYFATREGVPLALTPVMPQQDGPALPQTFSISLAVRRGDAARKELLDRFLVRRHDEIEALLDEFHVPRVAAMPRPAVRAAHARAGADARAPGEGR